MFTPLVCSVVFFMELSDKYGRFCGKFEICGSTLVSEILVFFNLFADIHLLTVFVQTLCVHTHSLWVPLANQACHHELITPPSFQNMVTSDSKNKHSSS